MNEIILIIALVGLTIGTQFLMTKVRKPLFYIIRIIAVMTVLGMVWFLSEDPKLPVSVIMSSILIFSAAKDVVALRKLRNSAL